MKKILYGFFSALLSGMARMPWRLLYWHADALFFLLYYVVGYRKALVLKNLSASFPDKSAEEIRRIRKEFYRNFADYIVETIKIPRISEEEMKERMVFVGVEQIDEILESGQSIAAYFSHCFNWEWAPSVILWSKMAGKADFCQIYRPLADRWFDEQMLKIRGRFGAISIPKARTLRRLLELRRDGRPSITGFMADQKPSHGDPTYITTFLHQPTAMITGTETLARRLGMAAIYWDMEKPSRGHYRITVRLISRQPNSMPDMGLTDAYAKMLQQTIERTPALWLWSHNRWKNPVSLTR